MERTVDVATGESVTFSYELAGLGSRFFAVFIDLTIQSAVALAALLMFLWLAGSHPGPASKASDLSKIGQGILGAVGAVLVFLLFFGYFIAFEWRFEGRTPGKRILGIRVVRDGGFPLDFTSAVVRNVVRVLEFGFGFYALSAMTTLLSPQNRRLGDYAAGTLVVRDQAYERVPVVLAGRGAVDGASRESARGNDLLVAGLSEAERDLVRRYADRRSALGAQARRSVAAQIALVVRPKLAANFVHLDDEALLVHLAETALATS